jgi:hypothetical protein
MIKVSTRATRHGNVRTAACEQPVPSRSGSLSGDDQRSTGFSELWPVSPYVVRRPARRARSFEQQREKYDRGKGVTVLPPSWQLRARQDRDEEAAPEHNECEVWTSGLAHVATSLDDQHGRGHHVWAPFLAWPQRGRRT